MMLLVLLTWLLTEDLQMLDLQMFNLQKIKQGGQRRESSVNAQSSESATPLQQAQDMLLAKIRRSLRVTPQVSLRPLRVSPTRCHRIEKSSTFPVSIGWSSATNRVLIAVPPTSNLTKEL